jgi:hypothetical protein
MKKFKLIHNKNYVHADINAVSSYYRPLVRSDLVIGFALFLYLYFFEQLQIVLLIYQVVSFLLLSEERDLRGLMLEYAFLIVWEFINQLPILNSWIMARRSW